MQRLVAVDVANAPEDPRYRLNLGYRSRTAVWLGGDVRRQVLLHGIGIALEGSPLIYYGDEIGMGSLILDDRDGLRLPIQWDDSPHAGFTTGEPFREMIAEGRFGYREGVNVAAQFEIDDVIDPADTRRWITTALLPAAPEPGTHRGRPNVDTW